jgi:hypothetical protein
MRDDVKNLVTDHSGVVSDERTDGVYDFATVSFEDAVTRETFIHAVAGNDDLYWERLGNTKATLMVLIPFDRATSW